MGAGALIRDSNGNILAALSKPLVGSLLLQEAEALALFHSLVWAAHLHINIYYIETNSLVLANALRNPTSNISSFFDLVKDVQCQLSYLSNICVSHVRRDANQAVHGLAKQALVLDNDCTWLEDIPSTIFSVVVKELF
uniref:RNase H type-1 domain-containing protein n=1 Tax=Cannabis sativa TaxID=3483 RepID=A0A803PRL9_CANSA